MSFSISFCCNSKLSIRGIKMNQFQQEKASLWMGDLEPWMDENWVKQLWLRYGFIVAVKMIKDRSSSLSAGYCFVDFSSLGEAQQVLTQFNGHSIPGTLRIFKLNWASGTSLGSGRDAGVEYTIYVCDLPLEVNDFQLFGIFSQRYPSCRGAKIVLDPLTQLSKGYGFVRFADEVEQQRAMVEMNNFVLGSSRIRCAPAQVKLTGAANNSGQSGNTYNPTYAMNLSSNQTQSNMKIL